MNQFHGIATLIKTFKWRSLVFLYENTADARLSQTYIRDIFQENHLDIAYQTAISHDASDIQIVNKLHKLMMTNASIFVVNLSPSLASQVFINAKMLGMMSNGYAWIVTSKTMDLLEPQDSSFCDSMQGVLGFKSYIPVSSKLQNLTLRWKGEFQHLESNLKIKQPNIVGLWAYDAAWILAEAIENVTGQPSQNQIGASESRHKDLTRLKVSNGGSSILSKITSRKFSGVAGEFQITNRKLVHGTYEIRNIICKVERRVGFWRASQGLAKDLNAQHNLSSNVLDTIIWPGFSFAVPKDQVIEKSRKRFRIGVPGHGRFCELVCAHRSLQSNAVTFSGFCMDVFHAALEKLPYKMSPEFVLFDNQNGSYNDLVFQVYLQNFDAAVGDITILSNRSAYVDFTIPYSELGVGIMVKLNKDPWFFLKPISPELWIMSACCFLVMGFTVWLSEHHVNEEFQGPPARQIGVVLWFSISSLVYAQRERLQTNSARFVVGVWYFVVLILTSSYVANLSSQLTAAQFETGKGYIGYSANSFVRGMNMVTNLNFKDDRLRPYQSPDEYYKALTKGSKNGGVDAIIEEVPYIKALVARNPREYAMVKSTLATNGFGFAFPKGSPLVHEMSRAIAELREEGTLIELERKWFKRQSLSFDSDREQLPDLNPLSIDQFAGLFLINGISECIAVLTLVIVCLRHGVLKKFYVVAVMAREKLKDGLGYLRHRTDNRIADHLALGAS